MKGEWESMKMVANLTNKALVLFAKKLVLTNCVYICHRPEAPEELLK